MQTFHYDGICIQNRRKTNMDSLLLKKRVISGQEVCLAAVCDGVGSLKDGAVASSLAIQMLIEWLNHVEAIERIGLALTDTVQTINQAIVRESREKGVRTASTLSVLLLAGKRYYIAHVGDSRIYSYSSVGLRQLTEDQVLNGKLAVYLGQPNGISVMYGEGNSSDGKFLLCSDGLYKKLNTECIERYCSQANKKNIAKVLEKLVQTAVENGELDNISVALVLHER